MSLRKTSLLILTTALLAAVLLPLLLRSPQGDGIPEQQQTSASQEDSSSTPALSPQAQASMDALLDTGRSFEQRLEYLDAAVHSQGAAMIPVLMQLGDQEILLRRQAIAALGHFDHPNVRAYLRARHQAGDPEVVMGVSSAHALLDGAQALEALDAILQGNAERADGFQDHIARHIMELLLDMGDPAGAQVLMRHLVHDAHAHIGHAHAVAVSEALAQLGNPEALPAIKAYQQHLNAWIDQQQLSPQGQRSAQDMLERVQAALASLKR